MKARAIRFPDSADTGCQLWLHGEFFVTPANQNREWVQVSIPAHYPVSFSNSPRKQSENFIENTLRYRPYFKVDSGSEAIPTLDRSKQTVYRKDVTAENSQKQRGFTNLTRPLQPSHSDCGTMTRMCGKNNLSLFVGSKELAITSPGYNSRSGEVAQVSLRRLLLGDRLTDGAAIARRVAEDGQDTAIGMAVDSGNRRHRRDHGDARKPCLRDRWR